jgi:hypothetical protein
VTIRASAIRGAVAVVALVLLAGTVLAADPSAPPSGSPDASAAGSATTSASPGESALASAVASTAPAASEEPTESESESPEASETPEASEPAKSPEAAEAPETEDGPPSADEIARIVGRLQNAGIPATAAQVGDLAGKVGVGGAVRVLAFAQASGKTPAQILALFEAGKGWGQIDHELNLSIGPGIGWIMGNGHGKGHDKHSKPQAP